MRKTVFMIAAAAVFGLFSCDGGGGSDAKTDPEVRTFTVTWNQNRSGAPVPETETVMDGSLLSAPEIPEPEGMECMGWYRESSCVNQWNFDADTVSSDTVLYAKWTYRPYLTFRSGAEFALHANAAGWEGKIEFSVNAETWQEWKGAVVLSQQSDDGLYRLYFRGENNSVITGYSGDKWVINGTADVECCGSIMNLLNYKDPDNAAMGYRCFDRMFENCSLLTKAPDLPSMNLNQACYNSMFKNCTKLKEPPELPASVLAEVCFGWMFSGCSGLASAPELPAEELKDSCYYAMFENCTSLKTAPELPAEILADSCYEYMFTGCSNLVTGPSEIPAAEMATLCCSFMFNGCRKLTAAPYLPASVMAEGCCRGMFKDCRKLAAVQEVLPAEELAENCYMQMFYGCTGLQTAPYLPAETLVSGCYACMFQGCAELRVENSIAVQRGTLVLAMPSDSPEDAAYGMFSGTGGTYTSDPEAGKRYYFY